MKKTPCWLSLSLLFAAYSTFSWFLTHTTATPLAWVLVLTFTLVEALLLTTLFDDLRLFFSRWLRSDVGYFALIITCSLFVTVALVWIRVFGYFLVLIASEILARLDLQNAGLNRVQALLTLSLFSLSGLAVGWITGIHSLANP